nr:MAG TPA: DNA directed DNA polymerase [Caudoviricetes sp.]
MKLISDDDLKDLLINPKPTRSGQYIADCPLCGKEQHFYISRKTQMWDCKKCHEYGSIYKLLRLLDKTYLLAGSTIEEKERIESIREMMQELVSNDDTELSELPVKKMPVGWKVSAKSTKYLLSRGITPEDCKHYNIGATDMFRKYENYVLIPVYDGGEIRGFLGRYGARKVPDNKLRYNNSIGTEFAELLFGYDEITDNTSTVILVEGVFDKIAVDKVLHLWDGEEVKCVCTFGKKISDKQIKKLMLKGVTNVILLYDFDAVKEIKKYGLELEKYFVTSITYTSDKKDIDECSEDEALEVFTHLMKPRDFNEGVIGKLKK